MTCCVDTVECFLDDFLYVGVTIVAGMTHRLCQIGWADEEDIDIRNGQNFIEVLNRCNIFDLNTNQHLSVRVLHILGSWRSPSEIGHSASA